MAAKKKTAKKNTSKKKSAKKKLNLSIPKKKKAKKKLFSKSKKKTPLGTKDLGNGVSATIYPPSINFKYEW